MKEIDWITAFKIVCERGKEALEWGLPEPWVHAELYAALKKQSSLNGWTPFSNEIPYVTYYPVQMPTKTYRDWKKVGAVKWADLCLQDKNSNSWCWFEFKVRHAGTKDRIDKASVDARDSYKRDVVALMGFDLQATSNVWLKPDSNTGSYWTKDVLEPCAGKLLSGHHSFVSAFLQLDGKLDSTVWDDESLKNEIKKYRSYKDKQIGHEINPEIGIAAPTKFSVSNHSLVISQWTL